MTTYAIGDVHGCSDTLNKVLKKLPSDANLLFIGDLINRGPKSLKALRTLKKLGSRAVSLLGNHDLHLLAVSCGVREIHPTDTIQEILDAPDAEELLDWIRTWPMALEVNGFLAVHAATHWSWTKHKTLKLAHEVEECLRGKDWRDHMAKLFGKTQWEHGLKGHKRLRAIVNVLTRTRYLTADGEMDFKNHLSPSETDPALIPWFMFPGRKTADVPIVFGHWSTLGIVDYPNIYSTDTACLWGGSLTARELKLPSKIVSEESIEGISPW